MSTNDKDTVIHPQLSKCYNCYKASCIIDVEITQHPQFEHCKTLNCRTCKNIWYICVECTKRFSHSNKTRMYNHFANSDIAKQVLNPDEISIDCFLSNINNDKSVCNNN